LRARLGIDRVEAAAVHASEVRRRLHPEDDEARRRRLRGRPRQDGVDVRARRVRILSAQRVVGARLQEEDVDLLAQEPVHPPERAAEVSPLTPAFTTR
jgi:hypothetical protein